MSESFSRTAALGYMTKEQYRAARPLPPFIAIALALISVPCVLLGALDLADALNRNLPAALPIGAFLAGWFLAGCAYALRRLQLIEWRITLTSDVYVPSRARPEIFSSASSTLPAGSDLSCLEHIEPL
jgi:hypothetical protein